MNEMPTIIFDHANSGITLHGGGLPQLIGETKIKHIEKAYN